MTQNIRPTKIIDGLMMWHLILVIQKMLVFFSCQT